MAWQGEEIDLITKEEREMGKIEANRIILEIPWHRPQNERR